MTLAEALQYAADRLDAAALKITAIRDQIAAQLAANQTNVTTIINNFLGRPPVQAIFIDPVNGNDTNDGLSLATAKKDLDNLLDGIGTTATSVYLFADTTLRRRRNIYATLQIRGAQPANTAAGFTFVKRRITLLGTADNSPATFVGTFGSGCWLQGPSFISDFIDYLLMDQPATAQDYTDHFTGAYGCNVSVTNCTLNVNSAQAGALLGSTVNPLQAFIGIAFGTGATGHLFRGVAAGANPNSSFFYRTNVTSG